MWLNDTVIFQWRFVFIAEIMLVLTITEGWRGRSDSGCVGLTCILMRNTKLLFVKMLSWCLVCYYLLVKSQFGEGIVHFLCNQCCWTFRFVIAFILCGKTKKIYFIHLLLLVFIQMWIVDIVNADYSVLISNAAFCNDMRDIFNHTPSQNILFYKVNLYDQL